MIGGGAAGGSAAGNSGGSAACDSSTAGSSAAGGSAACKNADTSVDTYAGERCDPNLAFDPERFVGAQSLVALLEAESAFSPSLSVPRGAKRPANRVSREGTTHIGGLGEGTLHLVLKNYISANRADQEVHCGKKIADVFLDGRVYEIQTRGFSALKPKLAEFLPRFPVTVVYPIFREKRVAWLDPETGELSRFRTSPKKQTVFDLFSELVYLRDFLSARSLSFCVFELAGDEIRLLSGRSYDRKKFGAVRLNRVPTALYATHYFENASAFARLLPPLEAPFSVDEAAKYTGIPPASAQQMLYCLKHAGVLTATRARECGSDNESGSEKGKSKEKGKGSGKLFYTFSPSAAGGTAGEAGANKTAGGTGASGEAGAAGAAENEAHSAMPARCPAPRNGAKPKKKKSGE